MKITEFDEIYCEYSYLIHKVAYSIIKDYNLAQDVCQDTYIKFYERMEILRGDTVKAWLVICAKRLSIDYYRKYRNEQDVRESVVGMDESRSQIFVEDFVDKICVDQIANQLFIKLAKKNAEWYEILVRVSIAGEDPRIVARDLCMSVPNLRTKLHRVRAWAREELKTANM